MEQRSIYAQIADRTDGTVYIGVVGPCADGKVYLYQAVYGAACAAEHRKHL